MLTAISRYGARVLPNTEEIVAGCKARGEFIQGPHIAQFKILTPYPGTPMFKQIEPLLSETDWEKFDGYTPTFRHPNLTDRELRFLLGAAYKRFYMRPSYLANFLKIQNTAIREWVSRMDRRVNDRHSREEIADISRPVAC